MPHRADAHIHLMSDANQGLSFADRPGIKIDEVSLYSDFIEAHDIVVRDTLEDASDLSWGQAFATITSVPAQISGLSGRAGMLTPGGMGDVVMWDGDPLEVGSMPTRVFIDGVEQPLENHQSRLKDRYRDLDTSDLPKGYDW